MASKRKPGRGRKSKTNVSAQRHGASPSPQAQTAARTVGAGVEPAKASHSPAESPAAKSLAVKSPAVKSPSPAQTLLQRAKAVVSSAVESTSAALGGDVAAAAVLEADLTKLTTAVEAAEAAHNDFIKAQALLDAERKQLEAAQGKQAVALQLAESERTRLQGDRAKLAADKIELEATFDQRQAAQDAAAKEAREALSARQKAHAATQAERDHEHKAVTQSLEDQRAAIDAKRSELNAREEDLLAREHDRDQDFAEAREKHLGNLQAELTTLRAERDDLTKTLARTLADHRAAAAEAREAQQVELDALHQSARQAAGEAADRVRQERESALAAREAALHAALAELTRANGEVERQRTQLEANAANLEADVEERAAHAVAKAERRAGRLETERDELRDDLDHLQQQLADLDQARQEFGGDPAALKMERDELKRNVRRLDKELKNRPDLGTEDALSAARAQLEVERRAREGALDELAQTKAKLSSLNLAVAERQQLQDEVDAFTAQSTALRAHLDILRKDVEEAKASGKAPQAFRSCAKIVLRLAAPQQTHEVVDGDLRRFAEQVQATMAADPKEPRFYAAGVLRSFIAGLAANRLLLREGISGTGKTSLPTAFARAVGGGCDVVEVQAGWRDRFDLLGQYNSFDKQFMETEMLRALVRANQPHFADSPVLIVLDEMNLSHPEHYFADFLSVLERKKHRVELLGQALDNPPRGLLAGERTEVIVPPNVWFVGTANHDATTKGFADKTYDRAFVMNLRKQQPFKPKGARPVQALSFRSLHGLFADAQNAGKSDAERAVSAMKSATEEILVDLDVGWGARLDAQALRYIPVVEACGGSVAEAVDHLLTTKLLFKLGGRMDLDDKTFGDLNDAVELCFESLNSPYDVRKSQATDFLTREKKRVQRIRGH